MDTPTGYTTKEQELVDMMRPKHRDRRRPQRHVGITNNAVWSAHGRRTTTGPTPRASH